MQARQEDQRLLILLDLAEALLPPKSVFVTPCSRLADVQTALEENTNKLMGFPLQHLLSWQPFRLDALGIVTLLGAEEVNRAVGRFVRSRWLEYMPLLGAFVIAGDRISDDIGEVSLYNISEGTSSSRVSPWFGRLLLSQARELHAMNTFIHWTLQPKQTSTRDDVCAIMVAWVTCTPLVILSVLARDWWGLTNAVAIIASILVRTYIVRARKQSIDDLVEHRFSSDRGPPGNGNDKCLIITHEAKYISMSVPPKLFNPPSPFLADLAPEHAFAFDLVKLVGWLAFAAHVISLGMACLVVQIYTVALLVIPTLLLIQRLGCPDPSPWLSYIDIGAYLRIKLSRKSKGTTNQALDGTEFAFERVYRIGSYLQGEVSRWPQALSCRISDDGKLTHTPTHTSNELGPQKRQHVLAYLQLTDQEIESVKQWDLWPHTRTSKYSDGLWQRDYELVAEHVRRTVRERGIELPWETRSEFLPWQKPQV